MENQSGVSLYPLNYEGVHLLEGRFKKQFTDTRDYYFGIPDDDILKGFRRQADLPSPGQDMGGWCSRSTGVVFGQWLSGMARMSKAAGDTDLRDKAVHLMTEWGKALPRLKYGHYGYEKYVCGLVDLLEYAGRSDALPLLEHITDWAAENLNRRRKPATDEDSQGGYFTGGIEWYTLPENLYRAYQLTGNDKYRDFADLWLYPEYWGMFTGKTPPAPYGFHGYSHVNTLSSAAMTYAVTGDPVYLKTIVNAYDYFQKTQCYATGGYAPGEKLMPPDGSLGESIVVEPNTRFLRRFVGRSFETPCGTWAVFKLVRYLIEYTGEARYGDWMEQLLYNGIGAAPPLSHRGRIFYYADYRLMGGSKFYYPDPWPCCSGTYLQSIADYPNIIYFRDEAGLCVNLYVPSEVTWDHDGHEITVTQRTDYPESDTISLTLHMKTQACFNLRFRVPGWSSGLSVSVNGDTVATTTESGSWAEILRLWNSGDQVTIRIPMEPRLIPIDKQHPHRVALACGPVVLVRVQETSRVASREHLTEWISSMERPLEFRTRAETTGRFVPFYRVEYGVPYRMYFDLQA